jgi:hypothetical protein
MNKHIDNALAYLSSRNALPKLAQPVPAIGSDPRFARLCQHLLTKSAEAAAAKANFMRRDEAMPFVRISAKDYVGYGVEA